MADEEEMVELSAEEIASLRMASGGRDSITVDVPMGRGWSSPTFACHRSLGVAALSCCCPCLQFGLNQRAAFGSSCCKWSILWLLPVIVLYLLVDKYFPRATAEEAILATVDQEYVAYSREQALLYAWPIAMLLVGLVGMYRRRALRLKYGIGGTALGDFCCHFLCTCCSLAKEAREIRRNLLDEVVANAERGLRGDMEEDDRIVPGTSVRV